jgi:hypothetical protein
MTPTSTLDFGRLGGPVYVGRANGEQARSRLGVDRLDALTEPVEVIVPDNTYSINSSYFLGLFGESVVSFGSEKAFLEHYRFRAPERLMGTIHSHIERALREKGILKLD